MLILNCKKKVKLIYMTLNVYSKGMEEKFMGELKGRVTIPTDSNMKEEIKSIIDRWGADALRDCDGTKLSKDIVDLGVKLYSTYLTVRSDQKWARENKDELQQLYLMSEPVIAKSEKTEIKILAGYYSEQFEVDKVHDEKKWWEVIDRTTGEVVDTSKWNFNKESEILTVEETTPYHEYTVNFLVYMIWDPTQMYNHITNLLLSSITLHYALTRLLRKNSLIGLDIVHQ